MPTREATDEGGLPAPRSGIPALPRDPGRRPAAALAAWLAVLLDRGAHPCRGPSSVARTPFARDRLPGPWVQRQAHRLHLPARGAPDDLPRGHFDGSRDHPVPSIPPGWFRDTTLVSHRRAE